MAKKPRSTTAGFQTAQNPRTTALPSNTEIRRILADRVRVLSGVEGGIGIVVGIIEPQGRRVIASGSLNQSGSPRLNGETVFEIGSVTKVFTALLLADMVQRGEVALTAPVASYLPVGMKVPERSGRSITLVDLATHTSSLPFMPDALLLSTPSSAAISPTAADLARFLAGYELKRDIGTSWEYSNIGYWLLSLALTWRAGVDYESLLQQRVIAPLKLRNTALTLSPRMQTKLAIGHDAAMQPALAIFTLPVYSLMPAAGSLFSTVNDLLRLLSVALGYVRSPLDQAMSTSLSTRRPISAPDHEQALGWVVIGTGDKVLNFHDGGTFGYASCLVWNPMKRLGVVVLSNHMTSVSDIGRHLLRPDFPLEHPTITRHTEISLDATSMDRYIGHYEAPGEGIFTITREENHLLLESPAEWGLPTLRIRPESPKDFFVSELPLRVTVQTDNEGQVQGLLIYPPRGQEARSATRINV